jgi:hypothetical protein
MVSDIVLLEELHEAVQKNVEAYAGCISGAENKNKYLDLMLKAGFQNVTVLQEKTYPLDFIISEPETKDTIGRLGLTPEEVKEATKSIVSISVSASKP